MTHRFGPAGRIGQFFINSKLTPIIVIVTLLLGLFAISKTPREEEPQITVPFADVIVPMPGAEPEEVERRIAMPLEKLIWEIHGVEYVYSMSRPGVAIVSVRYYVGEDEEDSLVKLYSKSMGHVDMLPPGAMEPIVKSKSIDDVPVLTLTLWSDNYEWADLRQMSGQLANEIKKIKSVSEVNLHGGRRRQIRVIPDTTEMASRNVCLLCIAGALQQANMELPAGNFESGNEEFLVEAGDFIESAEDVRNIVVGVNAGKPVYLRDVAEVTDGAEEVKDYVFMGIGPASGHKDIELDTGEEYTAVTISVAKRKGTDAAWLVGKIMNHIETIRGRFIPNDVEVTITRDYGATAYDKVNELIKHLAGAILAVTFVILVSMGWRSALVILLSVPITFSLTLFIYYFYGYTLNRITLFALVFVTGIVIDDSIIVVENIHRHFQMKQLPRFQAAITAINEVGNPTILATLTVIAAVFPMYFVTGLMGPYMRPMPVGASLAMTISLLVAFIVAPFLAYRLMGGSHGKGQEDEEEYDLQKTTSFRIYRAIMKPMIQSPAKRWLFLLFMALLLMGSVAMLGFKMVTVKMLPFDNKSEFQVIVDMPEGTPLEKTARVSREIGRVLQEVPEVTDYQLYVGLNAPINFNGLVRQYYMRRGSNVADIQVNLVEKHARKADSHDIALRVRGPIQEVADKHGASVKIAEVPPGPPVMATMVAEIYGPDRQMQVELAEKVKQVFEETDGVVDVDWMEANDQVEYTFEVNKEKASLSGVSTEDIVRTMRVSLDGMDVGLAHMPDEYEPVMINIRLPRDQRSDIGALNDIYVKSRMGRQVPLSELVHQDKRLQDKPIFHKNLKRVVYVTGDVGGALSSPVYAILQMSEKIQEIEMPDGYSIKEYYSGQPEFESNFGLKWDGEWQITYEVFRDLGLAFGLVMILIYVLIVAWFQSFIRPLVMMIAIPLSLVGILPLHWMLGAFFTATSMIGFIALAGIMVRNSILLIDFAQIRVDNGMTVGDAVIESGAVRFRPIALTAGTVVVGAIPILLDPIFEGLAVALMGGAVASTILTLLVVPLVHFMVESIGRSKDQLEAGHEESTREDNE